MTAHADRSPGPEQGRAVERNRLEVIRFTSDEDYRAALQALIDWGGPWRFTSYDDPKEWWLDTTQVRRLQAIGVPFKWLTENT
jgi:hypothetical protein